LIIVTGLVGRSYVSAILGATAKGRTGAGAV
jgi:hypothetical protein